MFIMNKIKNAATIVLIRQEHSKIYVLMGRRCSTAVFMPNKYVFPGGVWEESDKNVPFSQAMDSRQESLLGLQTNFSDSSKLGITAIRELWEETGLRLSSKGNFVSFPKAWEYFFLDQQGPNLFNLNFFFRAVTPPNRTRRFDARFFFCNSSHIYEDLDDFNNASGELLDLQWIEISKAKYLNLPTITSIVVEHLMSLTESNFSYHQIPFYLGNSTGLDRINLEL